jgi:hypothetical protein
VNRGSTALSDVLAVVGVGNTKTTRTYVVIGFWRCAGHRVMEEPFENDVVCN